MPSFLQFLKTAQSLQSPFEKPVVSTVFNKQKGQGFSVQAPGVAKCP
jgi:hypothetical protein